MLRRLPESPEVFQLQHLRTRYIYIDDYYPDNYIGMASYVGQF